MKKSVLTISSGIIFLISWIYVYSQRDMVSLIVQSSKKISNNSIQPKPIQLASNQKFSTGARLTNNQANDIIIGTWTGDMGGKKIIIVIDRINGKELFGYNILGTNKRILKGEFKPGTWDQPCSKAFDSILNEPGDDKWDGVFRIKFIGYGVTDENTNECLKTRYLGAEAQGVWKSNNGKLKRTFTLIRQS